MKKVGVCGHFGFGKVMLNGQTIKTKILYDELVKQYGEKSVLSLDTHGWQSNPFKLLYKCIILVRSCENIIMLPASNGVKLFAPLFVILKRFFNTELHYMVIGGWLPELLNNNKRLIQNLKVFEGIYVETNSMKQKLNMLGLDNVYIVPNFKKLHILSERELIYNMEPPYEFCTFSRVAKEKGIEDAIDAIKEINRNLNAPICSLDIYGQIDFKYRDEFKKIMAGVPNYIKYKGTVPFDKSVEVLKNYYALLFPTYYDGEGFAGTILDAYASGVPVIASDWKYNSEIITNEKTGFLFNTHNMNVMVKILKNIIYDKANLILLKKYCIKEAQNYIPQNALRILLEKLEK